MLLLFVLQLVKGIVQIAGVCRTVGEETGKEGKEVTFQGEMIVEGLFIVCACHM